MKLVQAFFVLFGMASALGCSDASGTTSGGDQRFDAATPPSPDAGFVDDAGDGGTDGPAPLTCAKNGGATWSDLYRDCFGPMHASCGAGTCHDSSGATAPSRIWQCGDNPATCYSGVQVILENCGPTADGGSPCDPTMTSLYLALRKAPGDPLSMPRGMNFVFEEDDLMRLTTWIANGAKND